MDILTAIRGANLSKFSGRKCQLNRARIQKAYPPTRQIGEALASCPNPNGVPPGEKVGPYKKDELAGSSIARRVGMSTKLRPRMKPYGYSSVGMKRDSES